MKDSGKIALALIAGAAIGAAFGILFAPAKGSETREKVLEGAQDLGDLIKSKTSEGLEALNKFKEEYINKSEDIASSTATSSDGSKTHVL